MVAPVESGVPVRSMDCGISGLVGIDVVWKQRSPAVVGVL